jgi:hypothetical protein
MLSPPSLVFRNCSCSGRRSLETPVSLLLVQAEAEGQSGHLFKYFCIPGKTEAIQLESSRVFVGCSKVR